MAKRTEDDLFAESTMSFGDHLEELRVCLSKALVGLLIGFLLGLCLANYVVRYIQKPLKKALESHYIENEIEKLENQASERGEAVSKGMKEFIREHQYISEDVELEAAEVARVSGVAKEYADAQQELVDSADGTTEDSEAEEGGAPQEGAVWLGGVIPSPRAVLIKTRVCRHLPVSIEFIYIQ